ncbi:MAG: hypothetical protein DRI34_09625 [Deltaproteobacteria bacterium]|nr:MAG: hypothetical protein DRI34_09625 [Deltaproteobacteria bacterium]
MAEHDVDRLLMFLRGELSAGEAAELEREVDSSPQLQRLLVALARSERGEHGGAGQRHPDEDVLLLRGDRLGRYVVLDMLGAGTMGVVYSAFDPHLERLVAIKFIRPGLVSEQGAERLVREARAASAVAHPNVVAVYDLGWFGRAPYLVMEYVRGRTLDRWLEKERPEPRRVLEKFIQAAHGLAAAHRSGLVHRDFKPANVMVGDDGRVRVTDFGLALSFGPDALRRHSGTPAYMAPEQAAGKVIDARSDQYSFCAVLHQALFSQPSSRPRQAERRPLRPWRAFTGRRPRSGRIRRVLRRGMAEDPERRFPSMQELIAALQPGRTWKVLWPAILILAALAVVVTRQVVTRRPRPCELETNLVPELSRFGGEVGSNYRDRTGPGLPEALRRAVGVLRDGSRKLAEQRLLACRATQERGAQSLYTQWLRYRCLDWRLWQLRALASVVAGHADDDLSARLPGAVEKLPAIAGCRSVESLWRIEYPDWMVSTRFMLSLLVPAHLAVALAQLGFYDPARQLALVVEEQLPGLDSDELQSRVLFMLARYLLAGGDRQQAAPYLERALAAAARAHDEWLVAEVAVELVGLYVAGREGRRDIDVLLAMAELLLRRLGDGNSLQERLHRYRTEYLRRRDESLQAR